jgi:putative ABC transport system permease protein
MPLLQDLRLAFRRIRRNPLFSITIAGTLALGIGASTAMYTVVDGVLLKPLAFPEPQALVRVTADYAGTSQPNIGISQPELEAYAERSDAFEAISGIWPITANLTGSDRPERVEVLLASANYFDMLGVPPAQGRTFTERDFHTGIATLAVISDALWRRGFGSDPRILGRKLRIDEDVYEIIGVMPPSFRHPSVTLETDVEVWALSGWKTAPFPPPGYSVKFIPSAIGRLKAGVTIAEGRARVENLAREIARDHPDDYPPRLGWTPRVAPLAADLVAGVRPALLILMGAMGFVLVIAITNISHLLLVRAASREREIAVQRALGASRWRILSTVVGEGLILAAIGGAAGFLLSLWGVDLLLQLVPERLPRTADIRVDRRVFLFAASISAVAGFLAGLAPALQSARADVINRLREAGRGQAGGPRARLVRNALVVAQVAIAIVLLAGAGLLARSLHNLQRVDTGLTTDRLLTARLWLPQPNEPSSGPYFEHPKRVVLMRGIVERLQAEPGIAHAGMATALPLTGDSGSAAFAAEGWPADRRDLATATPVTVTPGYFPAVGITLISGRFLEDADDTRVGRAIVINEAMARTYFPDENPVGRRIRFIGRRGQIPPNAPWITIVGVVGDVREDGLTAAVRPQLYQSLWQASTLNLVIVAQGVRSVPSADVVQRAVQGTDPNLPLYAVRSGNDLLATELAQRRFAARLINVFAATALFLAVFGLHGVIAYSVRQRTHEIGVRVALGATAGRVMGLVAAQAARLTAAGVVIGLAAAVVLSRVMTAMLFNVSATDPVTLAAVTLLLVLVIGLATFGAARRASKIDAAVALRQE